MTMGSGLIRINVEIGDYYHPKSKAPFFSNLHVDLVNHGLNCILGLSGSGKTTILKVLLGLEEGYYSGKIKYFSDGEQTLKEIRRKGHFGFLPQDAPLIPWKTVLSNLLLPTVLNREIKPPKEEQILSVLRDIGLEEDTLRYYPYQLSTGMCHRISFIRALLYEPKFLVIDEIFTGLDTLSSDMLSGILTKFIEITECLCIFVTHDVDKALTLSNSVYFMSKQNRVLTRLSHSIKKTEVLDLLKSDFKP